MKYYIEKTLNADFETAILNVKEALKKEGFGVLSEIDIQEKLNEKLDVDFRKYTILGACNPPFALKALKAEDKIGVFLPCNVIVEEHENGEVEVSAVDPIASMISVQNESLAPIADEIQQKMKKVIENLG